MPKPDFQKVADGCNTKWEIEVALMDAYYQGCHDEIEKSEVRFNKIIDRVLPSKGA